MGIYCIATKAMVSLYGGNPKKGTLLRYNHYLKKKLQLLKLNLIFQFQQLQFFFQEEIFNITGRDFYNISGRDLINFSGLILQNCLPQRILLVHYILCVHLQCFYWETTNTNISNPKEWRCKTVGYQPQPT